MATRNFQREAELDAMNDAYKELEDFISTPEGKKALPNWVFIIRYINEKDEKLKEANKEIKKYQDFFSTLSSLLPRHFSIHDRID